MVIGPFRIHVEEEALDDLRTRLRRTRWPDAIDGSGWTYGVDVDFLRELVDYWERAFDWRAHEAAWNGLPHYRFDGIHFLHIRSANPAARPLVITHGWPGSFIELLKVVPLLTGDFHLVIPSLPGFGFSERPRAAGMNTFATAERFLALLSALGYERFFAQGGDFGANVTTAMALLRPDRVAAIHLNYIPGGYRPYAGDGAPPNDEERAFLASLETWWDAHGAYAHVQRNEPQTLAYALNDSPAGLAAWLVDKFRAWSDCGGDVLRRFTRDELLANVSLYWFTETIGSSARYYFESARRLIELRQGQRIEVPCAIARFPRESPFPPRSWIERGYDVRRWTEMPRGGHFAALEEPELLADDVRAFFAGC